MHTVDDTRSDWKMNTMDQRSVKCTWTWLNPSSTDGHFCGEMGWVCGGVQTATWSQSLHSRAGHKTTVAHLLQQMMYRKLLGSWRQLIGPKRWELTVRGHWTKTTACAATLWENKWNFCTATGWKTTRNHLWYWNWRGAASWRPTYISNWDWISQRNNVAARCSLSSWDQSAKRLSSIWL